jgi:hypothetical protein
MPSPTVITCKDCHSTNTARSTRKTFLERVILKGLGFHPWKCLTCKHRFYTRQRGRRKQPSIAARQTGAGERVGGGQGIILK